MDVAAARLDLIEAGRELAEANPDLGAILLECTNMTPWAADINRAAGLPVFSIYSFICWFQSALQPRGKF